MMARHPIRCRCGRLQAEVSRPELGTRGICYCRDCQAFAHFLGLPEGMLDPMGGTGIVAVRPRDVSFKSGIANLTCMSLSGQGMLRWYAACCHTPIGNTPRDFRMSHVGLVHTCLRRDGADLADSFGPVKMSLNRQSARGNPPSTPAATLVTAIVRYLGALAWSRVSGAYRVNPFFDAETGAPRVAPTVLTDAERAEIMRAVDAFRDSGRA
jgi:hypothetical protein